MNHENNLLLIESLNNCATKASRCATACSIEEDTTITSSCQNFALDCAETPNIFSKNASRSVSLVHMNAKNLLRYQVVSNVQSLAENAHNFVLPSSVQKENDFTN